MDLFLQYLVNGIVVGSSYALVAVGLTLIFGILGVVNFAHGEFYMLGAYAGLTAVTVFQVPFAMALVVVVAASVLLGWGAQVLLHRPLKGGDATNSIISSFGLAVVLQNAALIVMGPQPHLLKTELTDISVELGPVFLPLQRLMMPIAMVVLIAGLYLVLRFTWTGRSLRSMAQHPTVARLCGVRIKRVAIVTFMVGSALAGVAGFLMSSIYMVHPLVGNMVALKAFTVVILGGMGQIGGAAAAGLLLGVAESLTSAYVDNGLRDIIGFALVIVVLLVRPNGIFGRRSERS